MASYVPSEAERKLWKVQGRWLQNARQKRFKTTWDAAKTLGIAEVTLRDHENGVRPIRDDVLVYYAQNFEMDPNTFPRTIEGSDPPPEAPQPPNQPDPVGGPPPHSGAPGQRVAVPKPEDKIKDAVAR